MLTEESFEQWLAGAESGERVVYYVGFLALGTDEPVIKKLRNTVAAAAMEGLVMLTQKRVGKYKFSYIAKRTHPDTSPDDCWWVPAP